MPPNSVRPDPILPPTRSRTPPAIHHAVEILPSSTLIRSIIESLSIPRQPTSNHQQPARRSTARRAPNRRSRPSNSTAAAHRPPPLATWHHNSRTISDVPQSPIDTLAAVASAESSSNSARPSKRARSEVLASPNHPPYYFSPGTSRPATSYLPSADWGANLDRPRHLSNASYTDVERLVAEGLLNLFHGTSQSSPTEASAGPSPQFESPKARPDTAAGNIWANSLPYSQVDTTQSKPVEPTSSKSEAAHLTVNAAPNSSTVEFQVPLRPSSVQTHTPPEENAPENLPHGASSSEDQASGAGNSTHTACLDIEQVKETTRHIPRITSDQSFQPQQLHSPQSLSAEVDDSAYLRDSLNLAVKAEVDLSSQGLGISVANVDDSQATIEAVDTSWISRAGPDSEPMQVDSAIPTSLVDQDPPATDNSQGARVDEETKCGRCGFFANSLTGDTVDWLQCNGCQGWFHFACTDFTAKEIQRIDKFYCLGCKPTFGPSTFVRKSTRARTNVDYSSLNEGFFSTVEENHEHRYIKHFKDGNMKYIYPETFPRMAPEDITLEYLERLPAMSEPIVIPAALNPRPYRTPNVSYPTEDGLFTVPEDEALDETQQEVVQDVDQDRLGMVIPEGLTVRRVADIHGPDMPLPVIDVKTQDGDSKKKWTLGKWADYYETTGDKPIRNVISLEVSHSPLGKLLQRPQVVRDLDLQDAVWPESDPTRKAVQFYVLMSVADCYTDFHVDFGGSSVYYHVLKGKKVFFFIRPTKQNLKKYEDWCVSPAQNETFLPDQTKECFRIDLEAGDTMLIPSGWIHSVWTPEDSLVVGGNFLTRLHLGMQLTINEVEKNTGVETKYRYPFFQKVQWYTAIKYLEQDPLPESVEQQLLSGNHFLRNMLIWQEFDIDGEQHQPGSEHYNHRYYSKSETEGWPELLKFIFRTVLIHMDKLEGITQKSRAAVMRSIPKGYGDPFELARRFACWIAWKRGNEDVPAWALADPELPAEVDPKMEKTEPTMSFEARKSDRRAAASAVESKTSHRLGPKKVVCENCREKKIACKHVDPNMLAGLASNTSPNGSVIMQIGDGVVSKTRDKELVGRLSLNAEGKRRWGKACVWCRRSKRRCIHDETGKIDPSKQNEAAAAKSGGGKSKSLDYIEASEAQALEDMAVDAMLLDPMLVDNGDSSMDLDNSNVMHDGIEASIEFHHASEVDGDLEEFPLDPLLGGDAVDRSLLGGLVNSTKENGQPDTGGHEMIDRARSSPRHTHPVERFSTAQYNSPRKANARVSASPSFKSTKGTSSSTGKSTSPTTLGKSASPSVGSHRQRHSFGATGAKLMSPSSLLAPPKPEEDASLRMALQLQAEEFGLRRRGG